MKHQGKTGASPRRTRARQRPTPFIPEVPGDLNPPSIPKATPEQLEGIAYSREMERKRVDRQHDRQIQEEFFAELGVQEPARLQLRRLQATAAQVEPVLVRLEQVQSWQVAHQVGLEMAREIFGVSKDYHYAKQQAQTGELQKLNDTIAVVCKSIRCLIHLHQESSPGIYDNRVALAWKPMEQVLRELEGNEPSIDDDLPRRVRGAKPGMVFPLRGDMPIRVTRRDLVRDIATRLRPLFPKGKTRQARHLAEELISDVLLRDKSK